MKRYYIIFKGQVQSRGFRNLTWEKAKKVGNLTGWVRNKLDGSVEMEIQGSDENINKFLVLIKKEIVITELQMSEIEIVEDEKIYRVRKN